MCYAGQHVTDGQSREGDVTNAMLMLPFQRPGKKLVSVCVSEMETDIM